MVTAGLAAVINDETDIEVVGTGTTLRDGIDLARAFQPDVVLLDHHLPDGDSVDGTRRLRSLVPPPRVVILTAEADDRVLRDALSAGCSGMVTKGRAIEELTGAVRSVAAGGAAFSPDVLRRLTRLDHTNQEPAERLSARELEVLRLVADGRSVSAIAQNLGLSEHTVRNHTRNAMTKLGAHSKLEVVVIATRLGLIRLADT
jgi:DNA-binding NarL/FixJ family response regulator